MAEIPESKLKWAVDYTPLLLEQVKHHYPQVQTSHHAKDIFEDPAVQAVVIASPAASHFELAKVALLSGKHVFIEKPIVLKLEHLEELNLIAQSKNLIVMEGHLLLYHPAVVAMKAAIDSGKIGKLTHLFFRRTALGAIRFHENAMWDFARRQAKVRRCLLMRIFAVAQRHRAGNVDVEACGRDFGGGVGELAFGGQHGGFAGMENVVVAHGSGYRGEEGRREIQRTTISSPLPPAATSPRWRSMPREARNERTDWARRAPSAILYSRVPRSSA